MSAPEMESQGKLDFSEWKIQKRHNQTCSKRFSLSRKDDCPDPLILLEFIYSVAQVPHQSVAESVQSLWPVQCYEPDISLLPDLLREDVLSSKGRGHWQCQLAIIII